MPNPVQNTVHSGTQMLRTAGSSYIFSRLAQLTNKQAFTLHQCYGAVPFWPGSGSSQSRWRLRLQLQLQLQPQSCSPQFVADIFCVKISLLIYWCLFCSKKGTSPLLCSSSTSLQWTDKFLFYIFVKIFAYFFSLNMGSELFF